MRYNAIYHIDKSLKQAEKGMMREEIIWFPHTLFGEPDLQYEQDMKAAILNLLPQIINIGEKKYSTFVIPKSILDMSEEVSFIDDYLKKYIEN